MLFSFKKQSTAETAWEMIVAQATPLTPIPNFATNNKSNTMLRKAATMAVCKINIDSDIRLAMTANIRECFVQNPEVFDPRTYLGKARDAVKNMVTHKIVNVLGCNDKA